MTAKEAILILEKIPEEQTPEIAEVIALVLAEGPVKTAKVMVNMNMAMRELIRQVAMRDAVIESMCGIPYPISLAINGKEIGETKEYDDGYESVMDAISDFGFTPDTIDKLGERVKKEMEDTLHFREIIKPIRGLKEFLEAMMIDLDGSDETDEVS